MKRWKEELKNSKENLVELVVDNPVQYVGDILEAIEGKWKEKILVIGNYDFFKRFSKVVEEKYKSNVAIVSEENGVLINRGRYVKDADKSLVFRRKFDKSMRGDIVDIVLVLNKNIMIDDEAMADISAIARGGQVITINPPFVSKVIRVAEEKSENNNNNKTLLQEEISRLYKELSQMDHNEKTTMTRERLINMIEKLEGLNKNHYSYVNKGDNFMSTGIGKDGSESSMVAKAEGIVMKVNNLK